uniref:Small integral membrane protein 14 n=1 Tax=Hydra vulgaris TaxID=6087 RepID=T2M6Z2_HYDVU|nr:small integral membrane protein 14 [Hydra vulgaris]
MSEPPSFDPCECIFSPAAAMQRLISLLRNSQSYCTDEQCFGTPPGPGSNADTGVHLMLMAIGWVILALVLYLLRPQSLRDAPEKPERLNDDNGNQPPPSIM